jgi:glycosyltransferase involved in cell wall biosynthesis
MVNIAILGLGDFENWNNKKSLSLGGASGVIKSILPYLDADMIYLMGITSNKKNLYKEISFAKNILIIPIIYVPKESRIPIRFHAFFYSRKINSILNKYNIHSVYSHAEEISYWINPGVTILYHMHGSTNALIKAKNRFFRNKLFQKFWKHIREKNIQKATKIIAIDQLCYRLTKEQNAEEKTILIPNFVDTRVFYPDKIHSKLLSHINGKILLFIGRLEEVKGLELFVDTLLEINRKEPESWKGVFVGRGTYEPVIKKYINDSSANDLFYFVGPVFEQDELRRIYNTSSVLMISSFYEGIPMVILESMACGTPVVSTLVGGVKDLIADERICFVIDKRDPLEFAELIQSITKNARPLFKESKFSSLSASSVINKILCDFTDNKKNIIN